MKRLILCMATILSSTMANAATYNLSSYYKISTDSDYKYFSYGGIGYRCGSYVSDHHESEFIDVSHGQTVKISGDNNLYYCCDNGSDSDGYWIAFQGVSSVPESSCNTQYEWKSLGANKYCQATNTATYDWCADNTDTGIIYYPVGDCVYSSGTCSTFTHCGTGYYKNGSSCTACPDGGTTDGYTNSGKTACYIPAGTAFSDDTGNGTYTSKCYWTE